jgi:hypothetical protein
MATTFTKGLFGGVSPQEQQLAQQKLWQGMYGAASSPYEKMGLALAQLGGAALGIDETGTGGKTAAINKILGEAGNLYPVDSADYYKYVAENIPAEYTDSRDFAAATYRETVKKDREDYANTVKAIKEAPETVDQYVAPLAQSLLQKATAAGWSEADRPVPTTAADIKQFAKDYGLEKTKEYGQYTAFNDIAERAAKKIKGEETLQDLNITDKKVSIDLGRKKLTEASKDVGAAQEFFRVNGLDYNKPLEPQLSGSQKAFGLQGFITAQKKALEGGTTTAAPAPAAAKLTPQDQVALNWANSNPKDPRAAAIKQKLGR